MALLIPKCSSLASGSMLYKASPLSILQQKQSWLWLKERESNLFLAAILFMGVPK